MSAARGALLVLAAALAVATAAIVAVVAVRPPATVRVAPGTPVAALAAAHPGAVLELAPGRHPAFTLATPATVRALPGAVVDGGVVVRADGARLEHVVVRGGENGVTVAGARGVVLDGVSVDGAQQHGIEVVEGTATIRGCAVTGMPDRYSQAIEVRNSAGLGRTVVAGCRVAGAAEGLVAHVSRVELRGNAVTATTNRAIAVTEMSEGLVAGNTVRDVTGAGVYCGDMSHCEVRDNVVRGVTGDGSGVRSRSGQAIVAWYYATLRSVGNDIDVAADEPVGVYHGSVVTDRFPLSVWAPGWRGALGVVPVTAAALAVLAILRVLVAPVARRWAARRRLRAGAASAAYAVAAVTAVQGFHLFEHTVQVWQVSVADAAHRAGLLGAAVDGEWLHLGFNTVVFAGLVVTAAALGRVVVPVGQRTVVAGWLFAALALQGYHVVEHVVKVAQHLTSGVATAPGLLGGRVGLVGFHFAVNVAVTAGLVPAALLVAHTAAARWSLRQAQSAAATPVGHATPVPPMPQ